MQQRIRPRYELTNYRWMAGLTIPLLAKAIGTNTTTLQRWEAGTQDPQPEFVEKLCTFFDVDHPKKLNLDVQFTAPSQSREERIAMLRRELIELFKASPIVAGVDLSALLSATIDDPNELLHACRVVLDECWSYCNQNSYALADNTITAFMPGLRDLAMRRSPHQHDAALLAVEAKVLQIIIATQQEDYKRRGLLGSEIVLLGEMSGDKDLHTMAIGWHSNTYVNCYFQPEIAIAILNNALPYSNDVSSLNKTDIYMELARACALDKSDTDKEATKAGNYIELAHMAMPEKPELEPLYRLTDLGEAEFGMREGKMYLILARRFPSQKKYAERAHDIFVESASRQFLNRINLGGMLIYKADAARAIGNMNDYLDCLTEGLCIALQIGSNREMTHAIAVIQSCPPRWRNEQKYKDLQKEVRRIMTPAKGIVIARR